MQCDPSRDAEAIEVQLLLEAIRARYDYDLRGYTAASMHRRVLTALTKSGLPNLGELQHRLLTDPSVFASVLEDLIVQTSDLFRDPSFCLAFRTKVVPVLRTYPLLRIWHAGCASGEEAYACAITLSEEGLYDRAQLYATDLSAQAVDQAKAGVYSLSRLPTFESNYRQAGGTAQLANYWTEAYERVAMKASLRRNMLFFQHNLVSDASFGEMHVIFCRNVFIYFDRELRQRVLRKFAQSLRPGGFLCLGNSERLGLLAEFEEFDGHEGIYRRTLC
jgi:chemotaxis protein methyltransferase CheR